MIDADEDNKVPDRIVTQRQSPTNQQQIEYLVRWKGKPPAEDTWEPETTFMDTDVDTYELLEQWISADKQAKQIKTVTRAGRQSRKPTAYWTTDESEAST